MNIDYEQWKNNYLDKINNSKKINSTQKNILNLINTNNKTEFQKNILDRLLKNEFNKYKFELEFKKKLSTIDDKSKEYLTKLKRKSPDPRKKRAHELISIGALTDVANFPKDRGIILGSYLYVLDLVKNRPDFFDELKTRGDKFLHDREKSKLS